MTHSIHFFRPTRALIDCSALRHNLHVLRAALPENAFFCPMVKANAYGHGDVEVSRVLEQEGVRVLGVGLVEEGELLRQMGSKAPILVFGTWGPEGGAAVLRHHLTPVVSLWEQLEWLGSTSPALPTPIHLKFDTGMRRLGFALDEAPALLSFVQKHAPQFRVEAVLTHLHSGEDATNPRGRSWQQLQQFQVIEKLFSTGGSFSHTLNSAGLLSWMRYGSASPPWPGLMRAPGVRPGLSLYGYSPLAPNEGMDLDLRPVMSLRSEVTRFHQVKVGEGVSYGQTWTAPRPSVVGVVPIGYADGYHRSLSNRGSALFLGAKVPVVGNVCMDYLMIDVTDALAGRSPQALTKAEREVTLWGQDAHGNKWGADEVARQAGTAVWEILTSVGERVPRVYLNSGSGYNLHQDG